MPLLPPEEQQITLTEFVNICIHLLDFAYLYTV